MRYVPNAVTLFGLAAGVAGVALGLQLGWPLLALSLLCDVLDGWLARRLHAETRFGAQLDWLGDVALSHAFAWRFLPVAAAAAASLLLVLWQASASLRTRRSSGRAPLWLGVIAGEVLAVLAPFGPLHARSHEIYMGVPGTGKTTLAVARVDEARRVVFFCPTGDLEPQGRVLTPEQLAGDAELERGTWCRIVVKAWDRDDVAPAFLATLAACRRAGQRAPLILVPDEVGDYRAECERELGALHRNGHKDGVTSVLISQVATDFPLTCRRTATRVVSLLQEDPEDLKALRERYGDQFAERARAWGPGQPPAVWERAPLWR